MLLSLIVCTRNRAEALKRCLVAIARLDCAAEWELVIVDNGSSDHTALVAQDFRQAVPFPVKIVHQPVRGLSNARNAGIAASEGEIIVFTDDDCYVSPGFLTVALEAYSDPRLGYSTGRVTLHDKSDFPATINESKTPATFLPGAYLPTGAVKGANMAFRREVLEEIGGFDPQFGSGASYASEDCDAAARASLAGWLGRYEPSMEVAHHHGRKAGDVKSLLRDYDFARGAYHAKLMLVCGAWKLSLRGWRGLARRAFHRPVSIYWESRGALHFLLNGLKQHNNPVRSR